MPELGTENPWDIPIKRKRNAVDKIICSQEKYATKLKQNLLTAQTDQLVSKVSLQKQHRVVQLFSLSQPSCTEIEQKENVPCTFESIGEPRISMSHDPPPIRPVVMPPSSINTEKKPSGEQPKMSIATPPRSFLPRRGSFMGKVLPISGVSVEVNQIPHVETPGKSFASVPIHNETEQPESLCKSQEVLSLSPRKAATVLPGSVAPIPSSHTQSDNFPPRCSSVGSRYPRKRPEPTHNFLKLNLRKKCFSRKGTLRQKALQRKARFAKFKRKFGTSKAVRDGTSCYRCGQEGHWANKCPLSVMESKPLGDSHTPDQHAFKLASSSWRILECKTLDEKYHGIQFEDLIHCPPSVPVQRSLTSHTLATLDEMLQDSLQHFGHRGFRPGQKLTALRILRGQSTLAVLPTAAGKSLCYQLPAMIHQKLSGSVALVVSPLISLMQDQITSKFSSVQGAFLNSSQSGAIKEEILEDARNGKYAFLLVSPEALVESDWLLQPGRLPPISFVCIDEAHCLADWSHHFRPSYLRLCRLLRSCLSVTCFLGLSATCTPETIKNVCSNLGIESPNRLTGETIDDASLSLPGYVQPIFSPIPSHLCITASTDIERDSGLITLLTRPPFSRLKGGILIYCATRDLTERLASFIRTTLQGVVDQVGRRRLEWTTAAYHAGQTATERSRVQKRFMNGRIRVLVATSAFGMGLNKPDLQAVIHYSLTKSFENYIQEIGRVGRAQQESYCHAFLPPAIGTDPREANELRRHIFANHIDLVMLKKFLRMCFDGVKCTCRPPGRCSGHVNAIDPVAVGEALDIKPESLATLLAFMELDPDGPLISILQPAYAIATVDCYGGPAELAYASQRCLAVAAGLGLEVERKGKDSVFLSRQVTINLIDACNRWGWRPSTVRQELRGLEWDTHSSSSGNSQPYRTGINVKFSQWSCWFWVHGPHIPVSPERLDQCLQYLQHRLRAVETAGLSSIDRLAHALACVAETEVDKVYSETVLDDGTDRFKQASKRRTERSDTVHKLILAHFNETVKPGEQHNEVEHSDDFHWPPPITNAQITSVQTSVREFIRMHGSSLDACLSGRTLANLFHGISTPQYPSSTWSRCRRFWRSHLDVDWPRIQQIATKEILNSMLS
ncbi:hypothetical protein CRM22_011415 [Opisthorchis felineus]|uniref:DNA 3'-5' helicase n=1 Tax=Opisthorchis felineus TaxID=147828 RepID=A0A4S2JE25_OPIFE|nr:hypothetical protein CRM22_011415 [Opisthorchis felineus]